MKQKSALLALAAIISSLTILGAGVEAAKAQSAAASTTNPQPKTAEQQFKNIKVLKDIPADQLIPAMQFVAASLNVECEFCHVAGAFEKDDKKPKQIARKMMEMMFAINQDNFEGHREVTCYSCHRGSIRPVAIPLVMGEEPKLAAAENNAAEPPETGGNGEPSKAPQTTGPSADQLFDKYLQAAGGAAAVDRISSRAMKGTITFGDSNVPIDIFSKAPDMRVSISHTPEGDSVTAFNGHEGWLAFPAHPVHDMHGPDIDAAAMDADLHFATHLKSMFSGTEVPPEAKIGDKNTYLVIGQREGKTPIHLYFDERSGLLVRLVRYGETPLGRLPTQIDYADYKEVGGVKIPFRWTLARPGNRFTIQLSDVKQNVPIDDAKFAKPPAPPKAPNPAPPK